MTSYTGAATCDYQQEVINEADELLNERCLPTYSKLVKENERLRLLLTAGVLVDTAVLLAPFVEDGVPIRRRDAHNILKRLREQQQLATF